MPKAIRVYAPKTERERYVDLQPPARQALLRWYVASGQPASAERVFPSPRGGAWTLDGYRLWCKRVFRPAAERAGLKGIRPYDLRHTFISALIRDGKDVVTVARQAGHDPAVTLATYAHEFESVRQECAEKSSVLEILRAL